MYKKTVILFLLVLMSTGSGYSWGFFGHKRLNRLAVFILPPEMVTFYKHYIMYITENSVNPDRRRYAVKGEAPRHYIDMDMYGDSAWYKLPRKWQDAVNTYSEDTLMMHGIVPWYIEMEKRKLVAAMRNKDLMGILRHSADLGHYIGDANVPLHTTSNYNGQFTGQYGIHGFWESRLPELFSDNYNFFVGRAEFLDNTLERGWMAVKQANDALDSVLRFERELTEKYPEDKKYSYENRGAVNMRVYSYEFSSDYHRALSGQVEVRMNAAIKMIGDYWYTCWVEAGQPDLNSLIEKEFSPDQKKVIEEEEEKIKQKIFEVRPHESFNREPAMFFGFQKFLANK